MRTSLYRHFDADGRLLYVGISNCHITRLAQHEARSPWFESISRVEIEHFDSRAAAEEAERLAIEREKPEHNKVAGRPPIGAKPAIVRLRADQIDRIDNLVGKGSRAAFIREAVANQLQKRWDAGEVEDVNDGEI